MPLLSAYDVRRLVSSSSTRCVQTLEPYAAATGRKLRTEDLLSEEDASPKAVRAPLITTLTNELHDRPASAGGLVVCTHRPVLPWVFDAVGLDDPGLATGRADRPAPAQGPDSGGRAAPGHLNYRALSLRRAVVHVIVVSCLRGRHETACPRSRAVHPRPQDQTPALPTFTT